MVWIETEQCFAQIMLEQWSKNAKKSQDSYSPSFSGFPANGTQSKTLDVAPAMPRCFTLQLHPQSHLSSHVASFRTFYFTPSGFQDLPNAFLSLEGYSHVSLVNLYSSLRHLLKCHLLEQMSMDLYPSSQFSHLLAQM